MRWRLSKSLRTNYVNQQLAKQRDKISQTLQKSLLLAKANEGLVKGLMKKLPQRVVTTLAAGRSQAAK